MGNKVISFDSSSPEIKSYEYTYADISMESENILSPKRSRRDIDFVQSDGRWKIVKKKDVDAVKGAVKNIFTWIPGEHILLPEFGNTIRKYLYEGITEINSEQIVAECQLLMTKWEPRAVIDRIFKKDSVEEQENNQVSIIMIWHVAGLPETQYQQEITL